MANSEEKVSKFVQAITEYAEEQRDKLRKETEAFKTERLMKAEQEVLNDSYHLIQKEIAESRGESLREMSRRDLAARKEVLSRRLQIMNEVFDRARDSLVKYTATSEYIDFLRRTLSDMTAVLPKDGTVYYLAPRDAGQIEALSSLCPDGSRIETADDIGLGGIRGVNQQSGHIVDNTLDTKLESQRSWFTIHSGLTAG